LLYPICSNTMQKQDAQTKVVVSYRLLPLECHEGMHSAHPTGEEPIPVILQEKPLVR
jgi:hypothetical protein